jgi:hypothetical protein
LNKRGRSCRRLGKEEQLATVQAVRLVRTTEKLFAKCEAALSQQVSSVAQEQNIYHERSSTVSGK